MTQQQAGAAASVSFFSRRFVSDEQMAEVYVPISKPLEIVAYSLNLGCANRQSFADL